MVTVNGEKKDVAGENLLAFLEKEGFDVQRIVVERNLEIIPREKLADLTIEDEDMIEVLRFVGGG